MACGGEPGSALHQCSALDPLYGDPRVLVRNPHPRDDPGALVRSPGLLDRARFAHARAGATSPHSLCDGSNDCGVHLTDRIIRRLPQFFFRMSRSIRSRLFSRRRREISAAGSKTECEADAGVPGRNAGLSFRPPRRQLRSIDGAMPSSPAICVSGRPLLIRSATASRLKSSVN